MARAESPDSAHLAAGLYGEGARRRQVTLLTDSTTAPTPSTDAKRALRRITPESPMVVTKHCGPDAVTTSGMKMSQVSIFASVSA